MADVIIRMRNLAKIYKIQKARIRGANMGAVILTVVRS